MQYFVQEDHIVRRIWGKSDTVLLIFAGAAAEFALNKAVDWLYFTGKLPTDPIGRLFSTVAYAGHIIFSEQEQALAAIDKIKAIHKGVESARGSAIPDWAYRDVLFMLIHYSISSFEVLERKLSEREKEEVFEVFLRVGQRMEIAELPLTYQAWTVQYAAQQEQNLSNSHFTKDLFVQYKKQLGAFRYLVLIEGQKLVVSPVVASMLKQGQLKPLLAVLPLYKLAKKIKIADALKWCLLPKAYWRQIKELDRV